MNEWINIVFYVIIMMTQWSPSLYLKHLWSNCHKMPLSIFLKWACDGVPHCPPPPGMNTGMHVWINEFIWVNEWISKWLNVWNAWFLNLAFKALYSQAPEYFSSPISSLSSTLQNEILPPSFIKLLSLEHSLNFSLECLIPVIFSYCYHNYP